MKIYTKTGDKGETSLFGGQRVLKNDLIVECYGTVDELNSVLGLAVTEITESGIIKVIQKIQNDLFDLGSELATPINKNKKNIPRISSDNISYLENSIDRFEEQLPELKQFILPGGTKGASLLHLSRSVCRRGERLIVGLSKNVSISDDIVIYLNRLSDLLFVLARFENFVQNFPDINWEKSL